MAGKKKITVELIEESTKNELLDIAGRLGIEDKVNYKMLKADLYDLVLSEFLEQEEKRESPDPSEETEDGTEDAGPQVTAAEAYAKIQAQRRGEAPGEEPEPVPPPAPAPKKTISVHTIYKRKERVVPAHELTRLLRNLAIRASEFEVLKELALRNGQASRRVVKNSKTGFRKITLVVRAV